MPKVNSANSLTSLVCVLVVTAFAWTASEAAPGNVAQGLGLWLRASTGVSASNGEYVFSWADESGNNRNAVWSPGSVFEFPPIFVGSNPVVNGQPTVRFFNQNALALDLSWLAGSDYTIFVVNGRNRIGLANFYIAGDSLVPNSNLVLGYEQPDLLRLAHFNNDLDATVEPYLGTELWSLDSFRLDQAAGRKIFHNGWNVASDANTMPLQANPGATLGHFRAFGDLFWFWGDIAEVVIYDRPLSEDERLLVESELAGRYGFPLSPEAYYPCNDVSWKNHGDYTSAIAHAATILKSNGVSEPGDQQSLVAGSAASQCGK